MSLKMIAILLVTVGLLVGCAVWISCSFESAMFTELDDPQLIQKEVGLIMPGVTKAYCLTAHNRNTTIHVAFDLNVGDYQLFVKQNHCQEHLLTDQEELSQRLDSLKRGFMGKRRADEFIESGDEKSLEGYVSDDITWVSELSNERDGVRRVLLVKYPTETDN